MLKGLLFYLAFLFLVLGLFVFVLLSGAEQLTLESVLVLLLLGDVLVLLLCLFPAYFELLAEPVVLQLDAVDFLLPDDALLSDLLDLHLEVGVLLLAVSQLGLVGVQLQSALLSP